MQNPVHPLKITVQTLLLAGFCTFALNWSNLRAEERLGDKTSELRLLAGKDFRQDFYHAAIEITLKPGALTYWRQPGDAGVPPVFSFEGSSNLGAADVLFPAPTRIKEDEGEAFGYRDKVVFPLHVTPLDKAKPVNLKLTADYAVCERICIPAKARVEIALPSAQNPSLDIEVAAAEAHVPIPLSAQETAERVVLQSEKNAAHPSWRLNWKDASPVTDLFAEAPEGWYFETKKTEHANEFTIIAVEMPKTPSDVPVPITLTLTGPNRNFEFKLPLDVASAVH
jgi:DsbC/DsbD-like thiol-disulfide interchange protein